MEKILRPCSPEELIDVICWANAHNTVLNVQGSASKKWLGHPVTTEHTLDLTGFSGIKQYEPNELILTAGAGTPLAEIESLLSENHQMLAFEPSDYSGLFAGPALEKRGTLGGVLAGNISGPRRFYSGAARDHFLGFRAVCGHGEPFKSGGRVVKNVTGFDLSKLMAGSWGTLAACWEVTVKVLPLPEQTCTLLLHGLDDQAASHCMNRAVSSPNTVSGASYLPVRLAQHAALPDDSRPDVLDSITALRIEGPEPSVSHRVKALKKLLGADRDLQPREISILNQKASQNFWLQVANLSFLSTPLRTENSAAGHQAQQIWRLSVPPTCGWKVVNKAVESLQQACSGDRSGTTTWFSDQAGGLIWLACSSKGEQAIRDAIKPWGGHATLWYLAGDVGATNHPFAPAVFQPQATALATLTQSIKLAFDPKKVLNPGRMYAHS